MKLTLSYDRQSGMATITDGTQQATVWHSTVLCPEALVGLAEAVIRLLRMTEQETCAWADGPGLGVELDWETIEAWRGEE